MRKRINLDGLWELHGTAYGDKPDPAGQWIAAKVPGDVHVDLRDAGKLADMYYADNIIRNKWVTEKAWWYRRSFTAEDTGSIMELVFKGIDTFAVVYLNGEQIGRAENMFREYRFDVTGRVKVGEPNELLVCIEPVSIVMKKYDAEPYFACFNDHRIFLRKAQCHFGWDWAPDCPGTGIWDSVFLESRSEVCLNGLNIRTNCDGVITFYISLDARIQEVHPDDLNLVVEIRSPDGTVAATEKWKATGIKNFRNLCIKEPRLWWPNGMGDQPLYHYAISLTRDEHVLDRKSGRIGIREVRLEEKALSPDKMGFSFIVNGQSCFCKGANWVPLDNFTGSIADAKYKHLLKLAKEANLNMLRVWGGGIYEKDVFYDLCDELGLMVWQDFMFACGDVPDNHYWFVDNVRAEIAYQVERLRTHTCLIYWVGGNEKSGDFYRKMVNHGDSLFDEVIPGILQTLDPFRPYRRGSPHAYVDSGNHPKSGDSHLSALGETFSEGSKGFHDYRNCVNRIDTSFNSEFALQGPSRRRSFEKFIPSGHYWPIDDLWNYRITSNPYDHHDTRTFAEKQLALCRAFFGEPQDHAEFIKYGMTIHGEAMWDELFGYRCKRPFNSGALFWMYSDSWPTGSWSVVDWYGVPKASYYAAKRAARPLQAGWKVHPENNGWQFIACNDTLEMFEGGIRYGEETLDGKLKWKLEEIVCIEPNTTKVLAEVGADSFSGSEDSFLFGEFACDKEQRSDVFFPNFWKDIPWPDPELSVRDIRPTGNDRLEVVLTTKRFARCVHLSGIEEGVCDSGPVYVSDAYFDLRAGETRTVVLGNAGGMNPTRIRAVHWLMEWD